jgi:lipoprotein-anchoring transpeptidase ErfK/SrfK
MGVSLAAAKTIAISSLALFTVIGVVAWVKKGKSEGESKAETAPIVKEVVLPSRPVVIHEIAPAKPTQAVAAPVQVKKEEPKATPVVIHTVEKGGVEFPQVDRIHQLFAVGPTQLPIVETISYTSRVPWLKGRPAWIADYAVHYATSRHFIARGLNGKADYFSQKVTPGSRFNVFKKEKRINFHLLVDLSRAKMGFYYHDLDTNERVLLKTYSVAVGKLMNQASLTPTGRYLLGEKTAVYRPGTMGIFQDQKMEMIRVFGTRWLPFDQELDGAKVPAKGYGIHGAPWRQDQKSGQLTENRDLLGKQETDGSIWMGAEDMEELFAIVVTKATTVEIVRDFREAKLPGNEVANPTR